MQQLIQMDEAQTQSVEFMLKKIDMQDYLAHFQMLVNGTVSPAAILNLLIAFYNIGHMRGSIDAYKAENAKLKAIQTLINGLGNK